MSLEDTIRALVPGITAEHLARTVAEVREATGRVLAVEPKPTPIQEAEQAAGRPTAAPMGDSEPAREAGVEPATDEDIATWEEQVSPCEEDARRFSALVARFRQEQARAENAESFIEMLKGQRGEAQRERDEAVARAEAAEAALARVERVTAAERAVVEAARVHVASMGMVSGALYDAVLALRDAQEEGQ